MQPMKKCFWILVVAGCALLAAPLAANPKWHFLGERVVNDRAETDTIHVGNDEGRFRRLKLGVDDAPVEIKRVVVHFANGETQVAERNVLVGENRTSPTLDLKGGRRFIDKVVFLYEARSRGWERATVRLYGGR